MTVMRARFTYFDIHMHLCQFSPFDVWYFTHCMNLRRGEWHICR